MTLTEDIYYELMDGLEEGLAWQQFLAKYGVSKGPLYNAVGKALQETKEQVVALSEKREKLWEEINQTGLRLDEANQKIGETDNAIQARNQDIVELQEKKSALKNQIEVLESDLEQKSKLLELVQELEKLGFGEERLKVLHTTLVEMRTKRGLKRNEAVDTFFAELEDYDTIQGFTQQLERLEAIIPIKTLEAERWQAEADSLSRRYKDLNQAIAAVQDLIKHGVKAEQIISWNRILSKLDGPEVLEDRLKQ